MTYMKIFAATLLAVLSSTTSYAASTDPQPSVPSPFVTGPIAATGAPGDPSHEYPFFSTTFDLASWGYIEEEYFFEGTASRFDIPAPLTLANTPMVTTSPLETGVPYRTRMIVRRPLSPLNFNGIVVMEWQNVSFGFDVDAMWQVSSEHFMRRGYAWIGVSAQRIGVNGSRGLRTWSPTRYGTLDVTAAGRFVNDELSFDIFSQAAQAVRRPQGADPIGGLPIRNVIALGLSQSAIYLVAYQNAVHPLARVFDGFLPAEHGATVRSGSDAKAFKLLSESDVARDQALLRQPNTDRFRRWEVAGAAHTPLRSLEVMAPLLMRDLASSLPANCTAPPFSRIPGEFVFNALLDAMVDWINNGIEPPLAPDIEVTATGLPGFFTAEIARDSFGNALGGIRLAEHAVATATNTGLNGPTTTACRTFGSYQPFDEETLAILYPTHGTYVSKVSQITEDNVLLGFIVPEDAMTTIDKAAQSAIGKKK